MWDIHLTSDKWYRNERVSVRGYAFDAQGQLLMGETFVAYLDMTTEKEWQCCVQQCNGLFSCIRSGTDWSAAAVDSSRIYPLYYRQNADGLIITDDPYKLLQAGDVEDEDSVNDYMAMAAPEEGKTLVKGIMQVKPGHFLCTDLTQLSYYQYTSKSEELEMPTEGTFADMLCSVFRRMVQSVQGRQIVIPLSGGNDSRLILCMLRKLNYENVICYTVGRPANDEKQIAEQVANQLGYPLYYIDTTSQEACDLISMSDRKFDQYYRFIGNLGNFVWLFEYPAICLLRKMGVLEPNAVFVPGHAADFNAGSHLRKGCVSSCNSVHYLTSAILYDNCEYDGIRIKHKVQQYIQDGVHKGYTRWSVFQSFIFQNRLPHNINNSARIYECFGYDVRLPYWDRQFLESFRRMPYAGLENCNYYTTFIRKYIFIPLGVDFPAKQPKAFFFRYQKVRKRLKALLPASMVHKRAHLVDSLAEHELMRPLLHELIANKVYKNENVYRSNNQVIRDWYLMKVRALLKN